MGVKEPRVIQVEPGSELADVVDEAESHPIILEKNGVRYHLTREDELADPWANYDPEAARAALHAVAGSWADIDTEKMIEDIYRWREEGSRPMDRP